MSREKWKEGFSMSPQPIPKPFPSPELATSCQEYEKNYIETYFFLDIQSQICYNIGIEVMNEKKDYTSQHGWSQGCPEKV